MSEFELETRISLPGRVNDIDRRMFEADIFVLSSKYEGLPNVLIEAMCMGLPCITTDFTGGGARELITDGENGIIVPVGDEAALADAIIKVINAPDLAKKLGEKAKILRKRLSADKIIEQWIEFIDSVITYNT